MRTGNIFQLEVASAAAGGRTLLLRLALPLLLALPFVLAEMPPRAQIGGLVMLTLFISFFGSAVAVGRRRTDGLRMRICVLPLPVWLVVLDFVLAGTLVDLWQMAGVVILFAAVNAAASGLGNLAQVVACLLIVLVVLNLLGMLLAAAMKNNAEVHLTGALAVGIIAFVSGVFPVPPRLGALVAWIRPWNPVAGLAQSLGALVEGTGPDGVGWGIVGGIVAVGFVAALLARGLDLWPVRGADMERGT